MPKTLAEDERSNAALQMMVDGADVQIDGFHRAERRSTWANAL
jgi:hypothetical protein